MLQGDIKLRCRELLIQICDAEEVRILKGVASKDHVHMHVEYPPRLALSDLLKRLKGRSSNKLRQEFPMRNKSSQRLSRLADLIPRETDEKITMFLAAVIGVLCAISAQSANGRGKVAR